MISTQEINQNYIHTILNTQNPSTNTLENKVSCIFWITIISIITFFQMIATPIYGLIDDGFAHLMGLEVLRHGTCLENVIGIKLQGADPTFGGTEGGSSHGFRFIDETESIDYQCESRGFFYVFKDTDIRLIDDTAEQHTQTDQIHFRDATFSENLINQLGIRILPTVHAALSGISYWNSWGNCLPAKLSGAVLGSLTPTLRFKFTQSDMNQFTIDRSYGGIALKTSQMIHADRLGIFGTLKYGLNRDLFSRIMRHPGHVLLGLAELTCAIALSAFAMPLII